MRTIITITIIVLFSFRFNYDRTACEETERKIILVGTDDTKNSFMGIWLELIYTEAMNRIGLVLEYRGYPAKRASYLSDRGEVDGEISRVTSYGKQHPQMIMVNEPHFFTTFDAYGINTEIKLSGWKSLRGTNLKVNYRMGVTKAETMLPTVLPAQNIEQVNSIESGLMKVVNKRGDLFIDVGSNIEETITKNEYLKKSNLINCGIMEKTAAHCFLHKKNKNLAAKLSIVLAQMKKEGLIEKYRKTAYRQF